jgi:Flp pilus assembly protein TadG
MFRTFFKDRSGATAVEFALVAPVLVAVIAIGWSVWQGEQGVEQAKTALHAGALYYAAGGETESVAQTVVMNAWSSAPKHATASAVRTCYCDTTVISCSLQCAVAAPGLPGQVRSEYVTLSVSGSGQGVFGGQTLNQQEVVRAD